MMRRDVVIAGGGLIGLSCALELESRGFNVTVLDRGRAGQEASRAAAGMLAAQDPANPPELAELAAYSVSLYPEFLERIWSLAGVKVPLETEMVYEEDERHPVSLPASSFRAVQGSLLARQEDSLDPRKLMQALHAAVRASRVELLEGAELQRVRSGEVVTSTGPLACGTFVDCRGAWTGGAVRPIKGQMLRVHAPGVLPGVVRMREIYMVPRLDGSVLIGATVEDRGFDTSVHSSDLQQLKAQAAAIVRELADAPELESWAGLRPDTPDHLPLIGRRPDWGYVAAGHYRNGVLLAPGTARVVAQLISGEQPSVDLSPFRPDRFDDGGSAPIFAHV